MAGLARSLSDGAGDALTFGLSPFRSVSIALLCSFLLGLGDSCFNTQLYSILGRVYADQSTAAFAIFKFVQVTPPLAPPPPAPLSQVFESEVSHNVSSAASRFAQPSPSSTVAT